MKDVEKLTIKFDARTQLRDFSFLGISSNASGKSIEYYTNEQIHGDEKEITLFRSDFYLFYPIRKQIVVAFGENSEGKLGVGGTANTLPKAANSSSYLNP